MQDAAMKSNPPPPKSGRKASSMVINAQQAWARAQANAWDKWEAKLLGRITAAVNMGNLSARVTFASIRMEPENVTAQNLAKTKLEALGFKVTVLDAIKAFDIEVPAPQPEKP